MKRRSPLRSAIALAVLLGTASCNDDQVLDEETQDALTSKGPTAAELTACPGGVAAQDATGDRVVKCTKLYPAAPLIRLPADTLTGSRATFYGGLSVPVDFSGVARIWTRDGKHYLPVTAAGAAIRFDETARLPAKLHAPTNRVTYTLYQLSGVLGAPLDTGSGPEPTIRLTGARAVVSVDGCVLDSRLLGTWEGSASEAYAAPVGHAPFLQYFDESKRVPIRIKLDALEAMPTLSDYAGGALTDAATYRLKGRIENWDWPVTAGDKTFPALTSLGAKNPFAGASSGSVELYRLGNMHGQNNDGHWVLTYPNGAKNLTGNGMSYTLTALTAPALLLAPTAKVDELQQLTIAPHIPFATNGHTVVLSPVDVGMRAGQCGP